MQQFTKPILISEHTTDELLPLSVGFLHSGILLSINLI